MAFPLGSRCQSGIPNLYTIPRLCRHHFHTSIRAVSADTRSVPFPSPLPNSRTSTILLTPEHSRQYSSRKRAIARDDIAKRLIQDNPGRSPKQVISAVREAILGQRREFREQRIAQREHRLEEKRQRKEQNAQLEEQRRSGSKAKESTLQEVSGSTLPIQASAPSSEPIPTPTAPLIRRTNSRQRNIPGSTTINEATNSSPTPPTPATPTTTTMPSTPQEYTITNLFAEQLAARTSPTLLYLAPTSNSYALSCLGVSIFAASYGLWNLYDAYVIPHPGLWWLVPHLMAGISIFSIGTGIWIGLGSRRLIGSLSAVPLHKAGRPVSGQKPKLLLRLESRRALPFLSPKTVEADLSSVRLTSAVAPLAAGLETSASGPAAFYADLTGDAAAVRRPQRMSAAQLKMTREEQQARERENETFFTTLTKPFRDLIRVIWKGVGRVVARDGFATVYVNGGGVGSGSGSGTATGTGKMKAWKLDARDGWLLDEGVALDRLLRGR